MGTDDLARAFEGDDELDTAIVGYSRSSPVVQQLVDACRRIDPPGQQKRHVPGVEASASVSTGCHAAADPGELVCVHCVGQ